MFEDAPRSPGENNQLRPRFDDSGPLDANRHGSGRFVYVVDTSETIFVAPDGDNRHPAVLGNGAPALYAGELTINSNRVVTELNNLSGTFRFAKATGLLCVAAAIEKLSFTISPGAVVLYGDEYNPVRKLR